MVAIVGLNTRELNKRNILKISAGCSIALHCDWRLDGSHTPDAILRLTGTAGLATDWASYLSCLAPAHYWTGREMEKLGDGAGWSLFIS